MSSMDINGVLAEMRALAAQAKKTEGNANATSDAAARTDFGEVLKESIDAVNATQKAAAEAAARFEAGDPDADLVQVMIALQKADVSFKAMTEVRNKLVDAYREIMNMPI